MTNTMVKPWEFKQDDVRIADSTPNIIIFCEDTVSESLYFKHFETKEFKVNCIESQKDKIQNVLNAIVYCKDTGVIKFNDGIDCIEDGTQVWCVFDRDKEDNPTRIAFGNASYDASIILAKSKGIKLAYSNDAFELWVLLHFEEVHFDNTDRQYYYDRLTTIFNQLPNPNSRLQRVLAHGSYGYKKDLKSKKNFFEIVLPEIIENTSMAIKRAKALEAHFNILVLQEHEKEPYTLVHHLVEELIRLGKKETPFM